MIFVKRIYSKIPKKRTPVYDRPYPNYAFPRASLTNIWTSEISRELINLKQETGNHGHNPGAKYLEIQSVFRKKKNVRLSGI